MPVKRKKLSMSSTKRGDTIIEAMFAFAVFSLVSIVTVSMMNLGIAASERSLELTVARNELNAQAEALRFIHSSYISELTLPSCDDVDATQESCQQYAKVWEAIISGARQPASRGGDEAFDIEYPVGSCSEVYGTGPGTLVHNNAFVINTRKLSAYQSAVNASEAIIRATATTPPNTPNAHRVFQEAPLNARIVYTGSGSGDSSDQLSNLKLQDYNNISRVEGIWIVAVKGGSDMSTPQYYDFFIETCWYGSNNPAPTAIDTIVRLYNPEGA